MKLLIFIFICIAARSSSSPVNLKVHSVWISQPPSIFFKCNAFFVTKDHVVATAACFLCNQNCTFQVVVSDNDEFCEENCDIYEVAEVVMHPQYVYGTGEQYNIAVIKVKKPVTEPIILHMANRMSTDWGLMSLWNLNTEKKRFEIQEHFGKKMSSVICRYGMLTPSTDEYCVMTRDTSLLAFGPQNEGMPHVILGFRKGFGVLEVLGFRGKVGGLKSKPYTTFTSIPYYYSWIESIITQN